MVDKSGRTCHLRWRDTQGPNAMRLMGMKLFGILSALLLWPIAAQAEVQATFYSHEFGKNFPHAFIVVKGTVDATGEVIDSNYGFTAKTASPAVLMGSVTGIVEQQPPGYIAKSDAKFTVTLDDAGYQRLMAVVETWRNWPQKSYNLNKRNCVHFVMEAAESAGLTVNRQSRFFKKPRSFLQEVRSLNPQLQTAPTRSGDDAVSR